MRASPIWPRRLSNCSVALANWGSSPFLGMSNASFGSTPVYMHAFVSAAVMCNLHCVYLVKLHASQSRSLVGYCSGSTWLPRTLLTFIIGLLLSTSRDSEESGSPSLLCALHNVRRHDNLDLHRQNTQTCVRTVLLATFSTLQTIFGP